MNDRLSCALCGQQPCHCVEAECRRCDGEGTVFDDSSRRAPYQKRCLECDGEGRVKCQRGGTACPFAHCYCEAAWERQQEDMASEPPPTARERQLEAQADRDALRSGVPRG